MPYFRKSSWQDMHEKPPDKFISMQGHHFPSAAVAIIAPLERNRIVLRLQNAVVGNGNSVSVTPEIFHDAGSIFKRRFAVDDPFFVVAQVQQIPINLRHLQFEQFQKLSSKLPR